MKTGVIVIVSFIVSWVPFYCYKIVETTICHHPYIEDAVVILALSASCTMPFIYVYRNNTARKEALKIVCWWRPIEVPTPTYSRASLSTRFSNGHSEVRIVEPDGSSSLYSYATECRECGASQLVSAIKHHCPPPSPNSEHISRVAGMPRRQSTVSFKLNPLVDNRSVSRCRQCLRQDSASSASSDDPLLLERWRYPRHSTTSVRWSKQRLSNGSVATRSDSLASTNSSVLSCGIQRWQPTRRYSAASSDSGATILKKMANEDSEDAISDITLRRFSCQRSLFSEGQEEIREVDETIEFHGYANPFRQQSDMIVQRDTLNGSCTTFKWTTNDYSDCTHLSDPNIGHVQISNDHTRILKDHLCQIHPQTGIGLQNLARPEKMNINGSPDFSSPRHKKPLKRTNSNSRFLRIPRTETRINRIATRLEKDGLAFKSDSNLNEGKIEIIRETYSAE